MKHAIRAVGALIMVMTLNLPALADPAAMAPLWTVHIDEVQSAKVSEFERLNIAENQGVHAILRRHGQPVQPVYAIQAGGTVFMTFRPKSSFTDFDTPSGVPDSVSKLFAAVTGPLTGPIHGALAYHHNEVWRFHKGDSYFPPAPGSARATPGYIQLMSDRVIPGRGDLYDALYDSLKVALKKTNYPGSVLLFTSSYGDGAYKYLWQADAKAAFRASGDREALFTAAFGKAAARRACFGRS